MTRKRILVDLSATLLHYGHIRLVQKAAEFGTVIVGLTTDDEVIRKKGYHPELPYKARKEILESIKYIDQVVPVPWLIDEAVLDQYDIDLVVHGADNSNSIPESKIQIFPRTEGISSTDIRQNAQRSITEINNQKLMLTPGPAALVYESLQYLKPVFDRGDDEYMNMAKDVISWLQVVSGQDQIVITQGSADYALELAANSFVSGKVLLIITGDDSKKLEQMLPSGCAVTLCHYDNIQTIEGEFDWLMCAYTDHSIAFTVDLVAVKAKADECSARLYLDATFSIGLEGNHQLADVMAFPSSTGLFGLTGGAFIAYKEGLSQLPREDVYCNLNACREQMMTEPCHAIASLYGIINQHDMLKKRVEQSKQCVMSTWSDLVRLEGQPLLCTYIHGKVIPQDDNIVCYRSRANIEGSIVYHLGEIHGDSVKIGDRILVEPC